jgi:hypothetical protein
MGRLGWRGGGWQRRGREQALYAYDGGRLDIRRIHLQGLQMALYFCGSARHAAPPETRCSSFFALTDFARHEPKQNQRIVRD